MKFNRKILFILLIVLIVIAIIFVKNLPNNKNNIDEKENKESMNEKILKAIKNKESMNIYFINDEGKYNGNDEMFNSSNEVARKYKNKINKISKEYNFKYYVVFYHFGGTVNADRIIDKELRGKVEVPAILLIKEGKVIAYNDSNKKYKIINFLKKYNYIK